ncbi:hypothetical protein KEM55_002940 [Ascosphaera atra]|nr:hypothetical protein KEM55_002940 [Ascosphaera atra]
MSLENEDGSALAFTIPSLHDGVHLQCRIELPDAVKQHSTFKTWKPRAAIVAHPYAPLGGSYDDRVVLTVAGELLELGYVVGTFNFRGAGGSTGKTSWTGKGEVADYTTFGVVMLQYLSGLLHGAGEQPLEGVDLVFAGYSYGSMITSYLPSLETIMDLFVRARMANASAAAGGASSMQGFLKSLLRLAESAPKSTAIIDTSEDEPVTASQPIRPPRLSYLLVSPILPPVSSLTTLTFLRTTPDLSFTLSSKNKSTKETIPSTTLEDKLRSGHRVLAVFGDSDVFCGISKLRRWAETLEQGDGGKNFEKLEVPGADHFWGDKELRDRLRGRIREWASVSVVSESQEE